LKCLCVCCKTWRERNQSVIFEARRIFHRARRLAGGKSPLPRISNGQAGQVFVSTKGSTSPSKPLTRAEQEAHSAAERLNSQVADALAAVSARQTRDGVDEIEACADRLERAARDLSVALRELAEERRDKETL
jgi:hypothetical protein